MRRLVVAFLLLLAAPVSAQEMSANVERIATVPEMKSAIALNFIDDTMFVSTAGGVFSYDVSDPSAPAPLGALPMYIWENEDMDVDRKRKRLFISRDPRGFTTPATPGATFPYGAVHIIDVSDPSAMTQLAVFLVPAGHTTTCVNQCDFIWTAGPFANQQTQPDYVGRPIYATDVTDPANPKPCPQPIDTARNDGVTDYVHDVQVDSRGIAWVSGAGGIRGYRTSGGGATACAPIPYAGSGTPETATPSRFMHNSWREPDASFPALPRVTARAASRAAAAAAKRKRRKPCRTRRCRLKRRCERRGMVLKGRRCVKKRRRPAPARPKPPAIPPKPLPAPDVLTAERVLYGTEENIVSDCATSGRFVAYDLAGTFDGSGFAPGRRLKVLDTWTPEGAEGSSGCASAHYFASRGDGVFANSFYEQGVRFLDLSNPRDIRQVGWYRPEDANVWAPYFHKGLVFVADFTRGVDVLRFTGSRRSATVRAPRRAATSRLRFDRHRFGGLCPLP